MDVKLTNFGRAMSLDSARPATGELDTIFVLAYAVDLWAAGAIMYTMITGTPLAEVQEGEVVWQACERWVNDGNSVATVNWMAVSPQAREIIEALITVETAEQSTAGSLVSGSTFFR